MPFLVSFLVSLVLVPVVFGTPQERRLTLRCLLGGVVLAIALAPWVFFPAE